MALHSPNMGRLRNPPEAVRITQRGERAVVTAHRTGPFVSYADPNSLVSQLQVDSHLTFPMLQGIRYQLVHDVHH